MTFLSWIWHLIIALPILLVWAIFPSPDPKHVSIFDLYGTNTWGVVHYYSDGEPVPDWVMHVENGRAVFCGNIDVRENGKYASITGGSGFCQIEVVASGSGINAGGLMLGPQDDKTLLVGGGFTITGMPGNDMAGVGVCSPPAMIYIIVDCVEQWP